MLEKVFGVDGWLYRILNFLIDLILLNVVFLVTCIPVITIGAAVTSLYGTVMDMKKGKGYLIRGYLRKLRENFRKSTIVWLILLAFLFVIVTDFWILSSGAGSLGDWARILLLAVILLWFLMFTYVFPLMAKFENTVKNSMVNAFIIAMTRIGYTVAVFLLNAVPVVVWWIGGKLLVYGMGLYLLVGFSAAAYVNSCIFEIVFRKYIRE